MSKDNKAKKPNELLPVDTAKEFEVINWVGGHRQSFGNFGVVDLKQLTIQRAKVLVAAKFPKIRAKSAKPTSSNQNNK